MMNKLKNLLSKLNPLSWSRKPLPLKPTRSYSDCALILLNPIYEPITRQMRTWLAGVGIPQGLSKCFTFMGPAVNRNEIANVLKSTANLKRIKVFCGHGINEA